jgi:hypothetical protein
MNPHPDKGNNTTTDEQIGYLQRLLHVMIAEDLQRALQRTVGFENTNLVRRLPVICEAYLNPMAIHFKKLQEEEIKEIAKPTKRQSMVRAPAPRVHGQNFVRSRMLPGYFHPVRTQQREERFPMLGSDHRTCVQKRKYRICCSQ